MKTPESTWSRKSGLSVKKMNSREISERYKLVADYHTHTRYSKGLLVYYHGKGTIEENVAAAAAKGLREIGITDHGPGHIFYGLNLSRLPDMRRDVAEAARKYPEVKIQLGVEANIIHSGNGLDVAPVDIEKFDFINAGYHHGVPKGDMIRNPICSAGIFRREAGSSWRTAIRRWRFGPFTRIPFGFSPIPRTRDLSIWGKSEEPVKRGAPGWRSTADTPI